MSHNLEKASDVLAIVAALLNEGKPKEALEMVRRHGTGSAAMKNAYGVCLLRAGEYAKAIEVYRGLVIDQSGVCLKPDAPALFKANFAAALLLTKNVSGCRAVLGEIVPEQEPAAIRLRAAVERWMRSLSWYERLAFAWYGREPGKPVVLDFPPGELFEPDRQRPAA